MRLAWYNIIHDRTRFFVTVLGIACAVFLILFQASVLLGFLSAASKIIDSTNAELWITGRGVQCFEFPVAIERRTEELAHGVAGVRKTSRLCTRLVQFQRSDGHQQLVALVGAELNSGWQFPLPHIDQNSDVIAPESLVVDESNASQLAVDGQVPVDVEVNQMRARVIGETSGFSSFLGSPYVFTSYADGARYMGLQPGETMFVLVSVTPGTPVEGVREALKKHLPNVDVWTREEFAQQARTYWITQTGAGGAILTAAVLAFLIGLAIVSQAIYATTMENIEEFATLKAIGASHSFIVRVIVCQSSICGIFGYILGVLVTLPLIRAARSGIPWVMTPPWLPPLMFIPAMTMCILASILSVRAAMGVEPAKVFRA